LIYKKSHTCDHYNRHLRQLYKTRFTTNTRLASYCTLSRTVHRIAWQS